MPFYEQYAPYRQPLTGPEEDQLREFMRQPQPPLGSNPFEMPVTIQGLQVTVEHPVLNTFMKIAYDRADFDLQDIDMPTDPKLDQQFPGVDPKGKHCRVDMGFAQRLTQIKSAADLCEGPNKALLTDFLTSIDKDLTGMNALMSNVNTTCQRIKLAEHAAKVCPNSIASGILENAANNMARGDMDIQKMDQIFTAMEQVAGLRGGYLDQNTIDMYNEMDPEVQLDATMATGRQVKRAAPESFDVNFQNFDNIARQNYYANPRNWGFIFDHKIPKEPTDSLALAASMRRYAVTTASNALNVLFSTTEQMKMQADRGSLVIVDGKTINERMQEIYNNIPRDAGPKLPFHHWYPANLEKMSGEIVASALMAGKRVEAYVPGPDGKLPDQPTVLHRTGYEPTPDKPVTMNAWERFFNKLGFYKEKADRVKEYQALLDARERLKANYTVAQTARTMPAGNMVKDMFFGDYLRRNGIADTKALNLMRPDGNVYRLDRSGATAACICLMAAQHYDIRDILDPTKLQQEKKDVAELYMEHAFMDPATRQPGVDKAHRIGDSAWLGSVFFHGQQALQNQIDAIMAQTDLTNPEQRKAVLPIVRSAAAVMFDGFQECDAHMDAMHGYLRAAQQTALNNGQPADSANALADQTMKATTSISSFFGALDRADIARAGLAGPRAHKDTQKYIASLLVEKNLMDMLSQSTAQRFSDKIPSATFVRSLSDQLSVERNVSSVNNQLDQRKSDWLADSKMFLSGEFAADFEVTVTPEIITFPEKRKILETAPNGTTRAIVVQRPEQITRVANARTSISYNMGLKLGLVEPQAAQQTAQRNAQPNQPRSMGR